MQNASHILHLIGVPLEEGAGDKGGAMGPHALRTAQLQQRLESLGHTVVDEGDVRPNDALAANTFIPLADHYRANHAERLAAWTQAISKKGVAVGQQGGIPIFMGGDHSMAAGSINAVAQLAEQANKPLRILWLDAHCDFNNPSSSESGNIHGMPVAALTGNKTLDFLYGDEKRIVLKASDFHQFGIRSVDVEERRLVKEQGLHVYDMRMIDEFGVSRLIQGFIDEAISDDVWLHVSLDIDFLDPSIAPAVGTTVTGGATYREAHLIMEVLHDSGLVRSMDIAELNPFLDERGRSAHLLVDLASSLFGRSIMD